MYAIKIEGQWYRDKIFDAFMNNRPIHQVQSGGFVQTSRFVTKLLMMLSLGAVGCVLVYSFHNFKHHTQQLDHELNYQKTLAFTVHHIGSLLGEFTPTNSSLSALIALGVFQPAMVTGTALKPVVTNQFGGQITVSAGINKDALVFSNTSVPIAVCARVATNLDHFAWQISINGITTKASGSPTNRVMTYMGCLIGGSNNDIVLTMKR